MLEGSGDLGIGRETSERISVCWQEIRAASSALPSPPLYPTPTIGRPSIQVACIWVRCGMGGLPCAGKRGPVGGRRAQVSAAIADRARAEATR